MEVNVMVVQSQLGVRAIGIIGELDRGDKKEKRMPKPEHLGE